MSKRKLLLADDSITIQKVVNLTFADEGIEVTAVGNGDAAMEKINESFPDLILADVNMPGLSGYEICQIIKQNEKTQGIPVILLVGSFEPFDEDKANFVGANAYLTKPFQSIRQLVTKVTELLDERSKSLTADIFFENKTADFDKQPVENSVLEEIHFADTKEFPQNTATFDDFGDSGLDDEMIQANQVNNFSFTSPLTNQTVTDFEEKTADNIFEREPFKDEFQSENGLFEKTDVVIDNEPIFEEVLNESGLDAVHSVYDFGEENSAQTEKIEAVEVFEQNHLSNFEPSNSDEEDDFIIEKDELSTSFSETPAETIETEESETQEIETSTAELELKDKFYSESAEYSVNNDPRDFSDETFEKDESESYLITEEQEETEENQPEIEIVEENEATFEPEGITETSAAIEETETEFSSDAESETPAILESENSKSESEQFTQSVDIEQVDETAAELETETEQFAQPTAALFEKQQFAEMPEPKFFSEIAEKPFSKTDDATDENSNNNIVSNLSLEDLDLLEIPPIAKQETENQSTLNTASEPNNLEANVPKPSLEIAKDQNIVAFTQSIVLSQELIDAIADRVAARFSEKVIRDIAWEVVPQITESVIKKMVEDQEKR